MAELKPCPFCGGTKLGISEKSAARDYGTMVQYQVAVYCKDCNTVFLTREEAEAKLRRLEEV